jgi:hypothetical protein
MTSSLTTVSWLEKDAITRREKAVYGDEDKVETGMNKRTWELELQRNSILGDSINR